MAEVVKNLPAMLETRVQPLKRNPFCGQGLVVVDHALGGGAGCGGGMQADCTGSKKEL